MKNIVIRLTQEPEGNQFRVVSWSNSTQLSVGQLIPAARVSEWCAAPRIQVHIVGMTPQEENQPLLLDDCKTGQLAFAGGDK